MSARKEYRKDPVSGRWVKTTVKASKPKVSKRTGAKHSEEATVARITKDYQEAAARDFALVTEYLREDPVSPTGLVWATDNHAFTWLASYKPAGEVAGTVSKSFVNIKGVRIERLRAVKMLRTGSPIATHCSTTGTPYKFVQEDSGHIKSYTWEAYKKMAYGGQRGRRKV